MAILSRSRQQRDDEYEFAFVCTRRAPQLLRAHPFFHVVEVRQSDGDDELTVTSNFDDVINDDDASRVPEELVNRQLDGGRVVVRNYYIDTALLATAAEQDARFATFWQQEVASRWTTLLFFDCKCDQVGQAVTPTNLLGKLRKRLLQQRLRQQARGASNDDGIGGIGGGGENSGDGDESLIDDGNNRQRKKSKAAPRQPRQEKSRFEQSAWIRHIQPALLNCYLANSKKKENAEQLRGPNAPLIVCSHLYRELSAAKGIKATPEHLDDYGGWDLQELESWINTAPHWLPPASLSPFGGGKVATVSAWLDHHAALRGESWTMARARVFRTLWRQPLVADCLDLLYNIHGTENGAAADDRVEQSTSEAWAKLPWTTDLLERLGRLPPAPWFAHGEAWPNWVYSRAIFSDIRQQHVQSTAGAARDARLKNREMSLRQTALLCATPASVVPIASGIVKHVQDKSVVAVGIEADTGIAEVVTDVKEYKRAYLMERSHLQRWINVARYFGGQHEDHVRLHFVVPWTTLIDKARGVAEMSAELARAVAATWSDTDRLQMPILCMPAALTVQSQNFPAVHANTSKWVQAWKSLDNLGPIAKCAPALLSDKAEKLSASRIILVHAELMDVGEWTAFMNALKKWPGVANVHVAFTPIGCQPLTMSGVSYDANSVALLLDMPWPSVLERAPSARERSLLQQTGQERWTRQIDAWLQSIVGANDDKMDTGDDDDDLEQLDEPTKDGMLAVLDACAKRFAAADQMGRAAQQQFLVSDFELDVLATGLANFSIAMSLARYVDEFYTSTKKQIPLCMRQIDQFNKPLFLVSESAAELLVGKVALSHRMHPLRLLTLLTYWPKASFLCASGADDDAVKRAKLANVVTWQEYSSYWQKRRFALAGRCPAIPLQLAHDPFFVLV